MLGIDVNKLLEVYGEKNIFVNAEILSYRWWMDKKKLELSISTEAIPLVDLKELYLKRRKLYYNDKFIEKVCIIFEFYNIENLQLLSADFSRNIEKFHLFELIETDKKYVLEVNDCNETMIKFNFDSGRVVYVSQLTNINRLEYS